MMKAEVDEYGVLCVSDRGPKWWLEVVVFYLGTPAQFEEVMFVDAENAPLERVFAAVGWAKRLVRWSTEGGKAPWMAVKSQATPRSIAG